MKKFLKHNFENYQPYFEQHMGRKLCPWVEDNIAVKRKKTDKSYIELPKWFLCNVLLARPDQETLQWCEDLFKNSVNLNNRTYHQYACDQVYGTLSEAYHLKRLEKKFPNCEFDLTSSEFNEQTEKREIYCNGRAKRDWDFEVRFRGKTKSKKIHIKTNSVFTKTLSMRFRGTKSTKGEPEIVSIKNTEDGTHFPIDQNKYITVSNLLNNKEFIKSEGYITNPVEKKDWGGEGAYIINFKENILDNCIQY